MARTVEKVDSLAGEDDELLDALAEILAVAEEEGTVEWSDVSDDLTSGQWGRLIETGLLVDADGTGFVLDDPEGVREALDDEGVSATARETSREGDDDESSWSTYDKAAAVGAVGMFAGYSVGSVRNAVGSTLDVVFGPVEALLPFYVVIMVLAILTGLYSTLLQANLMDMEKMGEYQEQMQEIQEKRKKAKERGDDEALDRIQDEQMEAMGDQLGMFKEQFRPMVWIMLLTIPVFLWMYWMLRSGQTVHPETITLPLVGSRAWQDGVVGPVQTWIVWYFLCSMAFTQLIRKSLNIQTTPT